MEWLNISQDLIAIKLIYFLLVASLSCFLPYATLFCSDLGLTPSQIGIIFGIEPLLQFVFAPLWGTIADRYSKHKQVFLLCLVLAGALNFSVLFVPPYQPSMVPAELNNTGNCTGSLRCPVPENEIAEPTKMVGDQCMDMCKNSSASDFTFVCDMNNIPLFCNICSKNDADMLTYSTAGNGTVDIAPRVTLTCQSDFGFADESCEQIKCCKCQEIQSTEGKGQNNMALTFGLCMCIVLSATIFFSVQMPFLDALCFGILGEARAGEYGKQRLFGSIGWGIFAFVSGAAVDKYNENIDSDRTHYDPIFYMYIGFVALSFVCIVFMKYPPHHSAKKMRKNMGHVLRKPHVMAFFGVVVIMGIGFGITGNFLFLFMAELNSTYLIMGLSQTITTLAEIPCFFIAGLVLKKIGHNGVFCMALFMFSLRFVGFSIASEPWMILPFQVLHGPTFGLFWAAAVSYAAIIAPDSMTATLQTLVAGLHFGVGKAIGTALGGVIYEQFGSRNLFRTVAGVCIVALLVYWPLLCCMGIKVTGSLAEEEGKGAKKETQEKTAMDDKEADIPLKEPC